MFNLFFLSYQINLLKMNMCLFIISIIVWFVLREPTTDHKEMTDRVTKPSYYRILQIFVGLFSDQTHLPWNTSCSMWLKRSVISSTGTCSLSYLYRIFCQNHVKRRLVFVICISSEHLNLVYTYAMDITTFIYMVSLNFYQPMHDDSL